MARVQSGKSRKKSNKPKRQVAHAAVHIQSTYNNTIITISDLNGDTLAWSSAGACGFKGPKKSTPYAASTIVKAVSDRAKEHGVKELSVYVKGIGSGRDAAVRALNANGFHINYVKDITPLPHNGCRPRKQRRM
jgi:small subunit ribosomal protein S11